MDVIYNDNYSIYVHINKINGKMYVGQTCNKTKKRWNNGNGYKTCSYFYRAIQKYGWEGFYHEIIASNLTKNEADNFEQLLIKKLDLNNPDKGYNLQSGGSHSVLSEAGRINVRNAAKKRSENVEWRKKQSESHIGLQAGENNPMYGKKHTEATKKKLREASLDKHPSNETRDKMRESHIGEKNPMFGKHHSDETKKKISDMRKDEKNPNAKKVNQYNLDGVLIKTWDYIKQAGESLGIPYQNISRCCRSNKGTAGGFKWSYADN